MITFPKLETKRLLLDQIKSSDISSIVAYANNKNITDTTRTMPHPYYEKDAIKWIQAANEGFYSKNLYQFAIRTKSDGHFIGGIGLTVNVIHNRAELGYWLVENFWNNGYTSEAVKALLHFGFRTLKLNKIIAMYLSTNTASGRVMLKNGMLKEAEFKNHDIKKDHTVADGIYISLVQYRLTIQEYESILKP